MQKDVIFLRLYILPWICEGIGTELVPELFEVAVDDVDVLDVDVWVVTWDDVALPFGR